MKIVANIMRESLRDAGPFQPLKYEHFYDEKEDIHKILRGLEAIKMEFC